MNNDVVSTDVYFEEKGNEPFPIQRIKWLERVLPISTQAFKDLKKISDAESSFTNKVVTLQETNYVLSNCLLTSGAIKNIDDAPSIIKSFFKESVYNITFMYNWSVYKQIYKFDNDILSMLCNDTDVDNIPISIIKDNLPYPAFYVDNRFVSKHSDVEYRGCFVSLLYNYKNELDLGLFFIEDTKESNYLYCLVPLYFGDKTLVELMQERDKSFNVDSNNQDSMISMELGNQILKAIVYICSANKEVEIVKVPVSENTNNSSNKKKKKNKKSKTINQNFIGYKMGNVIRKTKKVYECKEKTVSNKTHKQISPHLRKAHYHHFWIGKKNEPENRKLILKFIPPLYINPNGKDIEVVPTVHQVKK